MRCLQSKQSEPSTHTLYCDPGPPSSQTPSLAYEQVLEQSAARVPQSMQSVPMSQELNSEPRPPSSQPPSVEYVHVFVQISATTTLETAIATAATRRMRRIEVILWPIVLLGRSCFVQHIADGSTVSTRRTDKSMCLARGLAYGTAPPGLLLEVKRSGSVGYGCTV